MSKFNEKDPRIWLKEVATPTMLFLSRLEDKPEEVKRGEKVLWILVFILSLDIDPDLITRWLRMFMVQDGVIEPLEKVQAFDTKVLVE